MEFSNLSLFYQSLVKMNSKNLIEVAGFQFEPERIEETQGEIYRDNGDGKSESDTMGIKRPLDMVQVWKATRILSDHWT